MSELCCSVQEYARLVEIRCTKQPAGVQTGKAECRIGIILFGGTQKPVMRCLHITLDGFPIKKQRRKQILGRPVSAGSGAPEPS